MATKCLTRSLLTTMKQTLTSAFSQPYSAASSVLLNSPSFIFRLRPIAAAISGSYFLRLSPAFSTREFSARQTSSSPNDPNPNWSNRPPKETILLDGCDFEHWLVVLEKPEGDPTRDDIIDSYIKTLAMVVGSEEEARMKIYSVSTRHYYAFGALVSEELSYKIKELPKVRWVLPDSYLDVRNKDYGGEPFINGQAVPYDPKYHEEWVRNNSRANERNRRNDRPRNFDRSRNFERRREMQGNPNLGGNVNGPGFSPPNMAAPPPPGGPNMHQQQPNNIGGPPPLPGGSNTGAMQPNNMGVQPNYGPNNTGNYPANDTRLPNTSNYQYGPGPNQNAFASNRGSGPGQNPNSYAPNMGPGQGHSQNGFNPNMGPGQGPNQSGFNPNIGPNQSGFNSNMGPNQSGFNPNMRPNQNGFNSNVGPGQGPNQNGYAPNTGGGNPYQNQNVPGRDFPQASNY